MINLRYHIISLTAVFLAIGIGLTLGSTFLDRATVENLNGQLENLEGRLADREERINELETRIAETEALRDALDEQGERLLADRLTGVPVVVLASRGVDGADVDASVQALVTSGADVQGLWWLTDRWALDDGSELDDLSTVLDETTADPSRLRRMAIDTLGGELRARQLIDVADDQPGTDGTDPIDGEAPDPSAATTTTTTTVGPDPDDPAADDPAADDPAADDPANDDPATGSQDGEADAEGELEIVTALVETGFIEFDAVADGPETTRFPDGTRIVLIGGSPDVPDDLVVEPLVDRMARGTTTPILGVASSALTVDDEISDLVEVVREDEQLRELLPTVDDLNHFEGWAAMVLALVDVADGVVGHYGLDDQAARLLPPVPAP